MKKLKDIRIEYCDFKYFVSHAPAAFVSLGFASREENANSFFTSAISGTYPDIAEKTFQEESFYINRHFL